MMVAHINKQIGLFAVMLIFINVGQAAADATIYEMCCAVINKTGRVLLYQSALSGSPIHSVRSPYQKDIDHNDKKTFCVDSNSFGLARIKLAYKFFNDDKSYFSLKCESNNFRDRVTMIVVKKYPDYSVDAWIINRYGIFTLHKTSRSNDVE